MTLVAPSPPPLRSVVSLLDALAKRGIRLWAEGDQLRFSAPKGALSPELRAELGERKAEVLALLSQLATTSRRDLPALVARGGEAGPRPASFAQERLWFLDRFQPGGAAYNIADAVRLRGGLSVAALKRALAEVVRRHEVLRTTFEAHDGRPWQVTAPPGPVPLPVVDAGWAGAGAGDGGSAGVGAGEAVVGELAQRLSERPMDLARGPLLRATLLRLAADDHVLVLVVHHIVSDGWSSGVLIRELAAVYAATVAGRPSPLAPLPVQYADYAAWQRELLASSWFGEEVAYWRRRLDGAPTVLELPTDRPRPSERGEAGLSVPFVVPAALSAGLDRLVGELRGATRFGIVLAVVGLLLRRWSGAEDLLIASPIANRRRPEIEPLIGFFVNTLVLRVSPRGRVSFRHYLGTLAHALLEDLDHPDVPFERLVEELRPERDTSRTPLAQVMLAFENVPSPSLSAAGLELVPWALEGTSAKFDLSLVLIEEARLVGRLELAADLFDRTTGERYVRHFLTLLEAAITAPERGLLELDHLPPAERHQLLHEWREPRTAPPPTVEATDLAQLIERQAERTPERVAIVAGVEHWSYARLAAQAGHVAQAVAALELPPEARVGVSAERTPELIAVLLGVLAAGQCYAPLDPAYPAERLALLIEDAAIRAVVAPPALAARLPGYDGPVLWPFDAPSLPARRLRPVLPKVLPGQLAYLIYTSGSTGRPKGVAIEHAQTLELVRWGAGRFSARELSGVLGATSINFDLSIFEIFVTLGLGGTMILVRDALALGELEGVERVRVLNTVPSAAAELVRRGAVRPTIESVVLAGEQLTRALADGLYAAGVEKVWNLYGPSEDTTYDTEHLVVPRAAGEPPIGRTFWGTEGVLLDRYGQPVGIGVPGELFLAGVGLARGYLGRPALTAERFLPNPYGPAGSRHYKSGDAMKMRPDGELLFVGRVDNQVKVRGFRIELSEIEAALAAQPGVAECAVLAEGAAGSSERRLVAYAAGHALQPAALRAGLAAVLPPYMVPALFVIADELPRMPNRKIDRKSLPKLARELGAGQSESGLPRTWVEEVLAGVFAEVLGLPSAGPGTHFFAAGGHSLLAVRALSRLEAVLGVALGVRQLFDTPTVGELARTIEAQLASGAGRRSQPRLERVPRHGGVELSFAQERLWLFEQLVPGTATYNTSRAGHLEGALDLGALARVFTALVARHETLRTRIAAGPDGMPRQWVEPARPIALPVVDLSALAPAARPALAVALGNREQNRPFDLAQPPMLRAVALRLGALEHVVLLSIHHVAYDLASGNILLAELEALYLAEASGEPASLPELPFDYADFAAWQRRALAGAALEEELAFWREELAPALAEPVELPAERSRPAVETFARRFFSFGVPEATAARLAALGRATGASQFMTFLALYTALLHRWGPSRHRVVGTAISNRHDAALEGVVGFFDNLLALRLATGELAEGPFAPLLAEARRVALGAYSHQSLPFEVLVQRLNLERERRRTPLLQTVFLFELDYPAMTRTIAGMTMRPYVLRPDQARFDLTFALRDAPAGGLYGRIEGNADLFEASTLARLAAHFVRLAEAVAADPERPLGSHLLLSAAERHQLSTELTARPRAAVGEPIPAQVLAAAAGRPEAIAISDGVTCLSYGELVEQGAALAGELRRLGVAQEDKVVLLAERSPALLVAQLAVWLAGGAYVPLDPAYPPARIAFVLADAGAAVLIADAPRLAELDGAELDAAGVTLPGVPRLELGAALPAVSVAPTTWWPEQLAYAIYTSGSTGTPKGVEIDHRGLESLVRWHHAAFGTSEATRMSHVAGLGFDASVWEVWPVLAAGGRLELPPEAARSSAEGMQSFLLERAVDVSFLPTPLAEILVTLPWPATTQLACVLTGGDRLHRAPRAGLPFRLLNNYGPTESTVVATSGEVPLGGVSGEAPSIGRAVDGTAAYVADARGRLLPLGLAGELLLAGDSLGRGYLRRPGLTADRFRPDPWSGVPGARLYRTGDRVRQRPDGTFEFLGRLDQQVKVRGFRIELGEVEAALAAQPSVVAAGAAAPRLESGARTLLAWVVETSAGAVSPEALRAALAATLPPYLVPTRIFVTEQLPSTAHGKLDRAALERAAPALLRSEAREAPRPGAEAALAELWSELLGARDWDREEDFFAAGGHSLLATQLASRVRERFGRALSLETIFSRPTLAALAAELGGDGTLEEGAPAAGVPALPLRERPAVLPLSYAQERMWFLDRLKPGDPAYVIAGAVELLGPLDPERLARALAALVARHESLRTRFPEVDGQPRAVVVPEAEAELDWAVVPTLPTDVPLAECLSQHLGSGFDLARGPLLRVRLVPLAASPAGPARHALVWGIHHIVADGWSMTRFLEDLGTLYQAFGAGLEPAAALPRLEIQYPDFALAQRELLEAGEARQQLAYWRERLAGASPAELPREELGGEPGRSARVVRRLPLAPLAELGRAHGASLFMTLAAGLFVVLARHTGERDLALGFPVAGRRWQAVEPLIGMFLNTLVLRVELDPEAAFAAVLAEVRQRALEAFDHQDVPFEKLLVDLAPARDPARTPFFQVLLNVLPFPTPPARLGELTLQPLALPEPPAKLDLTLYAVPHDGELTLGWAYRADRFGAERIEALAAQLEAVLAAASAAPAVRCAAIDLALAHPALPDPAAPLPVRAVPGVVERALEAARRDPAALALRDAVGAWTSAELEREALRLAAELVGVGLARGERVAVWADRSAGLPVALLAVLAAGGAFTVLDRAYPAERLVRQVALARPRALLALASAGPLPEPLVAALGEVPAFEVPARPSGQAVPADFVPVAVGPSDLAYVAFTSGSTGLPRGIEGEHGPLAHFLDWHVHAGGLDRSDRFAMLSGLAHDPLLRDVFTPLVVGACLAIPPEAALRDAVALGRWLGEEAVTVVHATPALGRLLVAGSPAEPCWPALRRWYASGDLLRGRDVTALCARAPGLSVVAFYGATETPQGVSACEVPPNLPAGFEVPIGRGIEGVQVLVLRPDGGLAGVGELGEVAIRSPYLARGYVGEPELTAARFVPNPHGRFPSNRVYRTGDLGRFRPDGTVSFAGRRDDQVKIRGFRVELPEVEQALLRQAGVREAVVLARPEPSGEQRLVAWVVGAEGHEVQEPALRAALASVLPSYAVPSRLVPLPALPLTPNGKVDRRALPEPELVATAGARRAPADLLELRVLEAWQRVLGLPEAGLDSDFFALGGHSLLAVELVARLGAALGRPVPVGLLFTASTPARLAAELRRETGPSLRATWVPLAPSAAAAELDAATPWVLVHPIGGDVLCYVRLARELAPTGPVFGLATPDTPELGTLREQAALYVAELGAHLPSGPVRLAGWSMGAVLAQEMARQLGEQGRQVELVALLDPARTGHGLEPTPAELEEAFRADLGALTGGIPDWLDPAELEKGLARFAGNHRRLAHHQPQRAGAPLLLITASRGVASEGPNWADLSPATEHHEIEGDHYAVIGPAASEVAALLQRAVGEG